MSSAARTVTQADLCTWLATGSGAKHAFFVGNTWCVCRMMQRRYGVPTIASDKACKNCIRIMEQHDAR